MTLRALVGAAALAFLAPVALAQSIPPGQASGGADARPAVTPPMTTSNDPFVQKRMQDKAAKKEYKAEKKAAKSEYKQEKREARARLEQELATEPGSTSTGK